MRGKQVSRDSKDLLGEAWRLLRSGTRELLVITQAPAPTVWTCANRSSTFLGQEIPAHLVDLTTQLAETGAWVRLHYVYPYPFVEKLVELMAQGKILPYLDVPFDAPVQRFCAACAVRVRLNSLNMCSAGVKFAPRLCCVRPLLSAFPVKLRKTKCFWTFSKPPPSSTGWAVLPTFGGARSRCHRLWRSGTEDVKDERYERFMAVQQTISARKLAARIGTEIDVVIDDYNEEAGQLIGRSWADAPEIDGQVFVSMAIWLKPPKPAHCLQVRSNWRSGACAR